jgi:ferredoxin
MAGSSLRVWVDQDECVSAGRCVSAAPGFFRFGDDELAVVVEDATPPSDDALIRIARACPNGAIHVERNGVELEL